MKESVRIRCLWSAVKRKIRSRRETQLQPAKADLEPRREPKEHDKTKHDNDCFRMIAKGMQN